MKKILLAEDDEMDLDIFMEAVSMSSLPIEVTSVPSCDEAVQALQGGLAPDIIILDGQLLGSDAAACISQLKTKTSIQDIPMFVLSGFVHKTLQQHCCAAGVDRVFEKPDSFKELVNIISSIYTTDWLGQRKTPYEEKILNPVLHSNVWM